MEGNCKSSKEGSVTVLVENNIRLKLDDIKKSLNEIGKRKRIEKRKLSSELLV